MNDFSINNAPLIIVLLFKGEWQSFLSSRGWRSLCISEKAWFTFRKVHLILRGFGCHFHSILMVNFLCSGRLTCPSHTSCNTVAGNSLVLHMCCWKKHVKIHSCQSSNYKYTMTKFNSVLWGVRFVTEILLSCNNTYFSLTFSWLWLDYIRSMVHFRDKQLFSPTKVTKAWPIITLWPPIF